MKLITEDQLAELMEIEPDKIANLRLSKKWPHVRLTRFDVRYTEAQVEQIVNAHSVAGPTKNASGLTSRSARRAS